MEIGELLSRKRSNTHFQIEMKTEAQFNLSAEIESKLLTVIDWRRNDVH